MIKERFRKYLPVVVDLETGGFDPKTNAILEIAATLIIKNEDTQLLDVGKTYRYHIEPYEGLVVEQESLDFTKINLNHPLRNAITEKDALEELFKIINTERTANGCSRAILIGHNAHFDHSFLTEAVSRNNIKKSPFHPFSVLDTVTLGALHTKQTVLARICDFLNIDYDSKEAHSAAYDSDITAKVFCKIVNEFDS
ncbi:MAG: ribonuclease T [SAR86 cluster bacterium]|uniref:Ribonuclease T n=1 Tax=SAR86 cluster bacterium TaxID=2030880 RepID=A0A937M2A0_9GAMM|nr:ribonuclease T [SAR86 cluster bacterium]